MDRNEPHDDKRGPGDRYYRAVAFDDVFDTRTGYCDRRSDQEKTRRAAENRREQQRMQGHNVRENAGRHGKQFVRKWRKRSGQQSEESILAIELGNTIKRRRCEAGYIRGWQTTVRNNVEILPDGFLKNMQTDNGCGDFGPSID
jgi:hypothetical protein